MASLTNTKISDTYPLLLKIETNGIDGTLRSIEDGDGTTSALKISSGAIQVDNIKVDGNAITSTDTNGNINLTPNGSGEVNISKVDIDSGTIDGVSVSATTISASGNVDFNGDLDVDGTTNLDVVDIDGATTITGTSAYASSATNLSTSVSKMALRVQGSSDASVSLWMGALANDAQQYIQACNDAGNGADDIVLNPFGGKVGIGIGNASPATTLDIDGAVTINGQIEQTVSSGTNDIIMDGDSNKTITMRAADNTLQAQIEGNADNLVLRTRLVKPIIFGINNAEKMRIHSDGNVGIGTASPSYKLHVADDTANDYAAYIINDNADGSGLRLRCDDSDGDEYLFYAENSTTARFAIKSDGKTGIGTASPQTTLHVGTGNEAPDIDAVALISNAGTTNLAIRNSTSNVELLNYVDSSQGIIGTATNHPLRIRTNNSDRITITSNGQVGIHTTSPNVGAFNNERGVLTISSTDNSGANNYAVLELQGHSINTSGVNGLVMFLDHTVEEARIQSNSVGSSQGDLRFYTNAGSGIVERVRVTHDGYFGIGKTTDGLSANGGFWHLSGENSYNEFVRTTTSDSSANIYISRANNGFPLWFGFIGASPISVGSVSITNSATSFNTTSDYRIKENEIELPNALSRVNNLKPYRFNFISDADNTVDGFFAHEVAEVVPEAVTGEKDAVDDDGEIEPQQLDHSKLVPILVKAVQELSAKVEALENA